MYAKYTQLESMTRRMIEESFGQFQEEFAAFIASSPKSVIRPCFFEDPDSSTVSLSISLQAISA